jgi:hypothetical protein
MPNTKKNPITQFKIEAVRVVQRGDKSQPESPAIGIASTNWLTGNNSSVASSANSVIFDQRSAGTRRSDMLGLVSFPY